MAKNTKVREDAGPERVPLHEQQKNILTVPEKRGFVRRHVNDIEQGNRIKRFIKAGWRIVEEETSVGDDGVINQNQSLGSGVRKHVGDTTYAILMEIPQELYDADQEAKADRLDKKEDSIYRGHGVKNSYGNISQEVEFSDDGYTPRRKRKT